MKYIRFAMVLCWLSGAMVMGGGHLLIYSPVGLVSIAAGFAMLGAVYANLRMAKLPPP